MEMVTLLGSAAALCTTVSFAPQAWKIIRTRDTSSISKPMYPIPVLAFALWLVFGMAIIIPNAVCLVLAGFILAMIVLPRENKQAVADKIDPPNAGVEWRDAHG